VNDVVAVVPDLFFQSRISAAAGRLGRSVRYIGPAQVSEDMGEFRLALVDLDAAPDIDSTIRQLRASGSGPVVVFGPHVDTDRRKLARRAGADRVLARSKFVTDLPQILAGTSGEA
jgi:DNA-binding response OmpR family regulator